MSVDKVVLDVARSIRPYLPGLVADRAADLDRRLAGLLRRAHAGTDVDAEILGLLAATPATHAWAAAMIADPRHRPPDRQPQHERSLNQGGYSPLGNPLGGDTVDAERYLCPVDGGYAWWRMSVAQPTPECPDHPGVVLVPDESN
jgi:hypothetical protein